MVFRKTMPGNISSIPCEMFLMVQEFGALFFFCASYQTSARHNKVTMMSLNIICLQVIHHVQQLGEAKTTKQFLRDSPILPYTSPIIYITRWLQHQWLVPTTRHAGCKCSFLTFLHGTFWSKILSLEIKILLFTAVNIILSALFVRIELFFT